MVELAEKRCTPCAEGTKPLTGEALEDFRRQVSDQWQLDDGKKLIRTLKFDDFRDALDMVNRIGNLADEQNHHPDIHLSYGKVAVELWTHKVNGLSEADFILAAKIDRLTR